MCVGDGLAAAGGVALSVPSVSLIRPLQPILIFAGFRSDGIAGEAQGQGLFALLPGYFAARVTRSRKRTS